MSFAVDRPDLKVKQLKTGCLAHYAYVVESNGEMAVIDPLRDIKEYLDHAAERQGKVRYIMETHYHADFVSGYFDLSQNTGAQIVFGPDSHPTFECKVMADNETVPLGAYKIRCLHTPGHTLESSCFVLEEADGKPICIFTGDTLFLGDVGRPDLAQKGEITDKDLARMLYKSLKKLKALPDEVIVFPGHGAGSACGKNIQAGDFCIIGNQKKNNVVFREEDEAKFVEMTTTGLPLPPVYFGHNVSLNKVGTIPKVEDLIATASVPMTPEQVKAKIEEGVVIIDCRNPPEFVKGHVSKSVCCPLVAQFAIWATYAVDLKGDNPDKIVLIAPPGKEVEAITRLARTGIDHVIGYLQGGFEAWASAGLPVATTKMANVQTQEDFDTMTVGGHYLDVRNRGEWEGTGVLKGAKLISLPYVKQVAASSQFKNQKLFVNCKTGGRALIAVCILERLGFQDITNLAGGADQLIAKGVSFVPYDGRDEDMSL